MVVFHRRVAALLLVVASACVMPAGAQLLPSITTRASVATDGTEGDSDSFGSAISADGRFIAFESDARNLVAGDTNGKSDVFVHDRDTHVTTRVSVATGGTQGNGAAGFPAISADGRYVAFYSSASNLVSGDANGKWDIFVHDRDTHVTTRVSVASAGTEGDGDAGNPAISADGRCVTFYSDASNLVAGDTNLKPDVFVHDRDTKVTTRVSVATGGAQATDSSYDPAMSADGRYVAFESWASNLVTGDTNAALDVFVRDRDTETTTLVSVATVGILGNKTSYRPAISADGRYVTFQSDATNLVAGDTNGASDIFVHDRATGSTGTTTRVSIATAGTQGNGGAGFPAISADGRYVAFASAASNLVPSDTNVSRDIFVHDRAAGATTRVSVATNGTQGNFVSDDPAISADGRYVAFESYASNLVAGDTNDCRDVFVRRHEAPGEPSGLTASVSGADVTLAWTAPTTGATPSAYIIQAGSGPGLSNLANVPTGTTATTFTASGVGNGLYYVRVRATNPVGTSGPSNEVQVRVGPAPPTVPGAPVGLSGSASGSTLTLSWTAPTTGDALTAYTIEAGSGSGLADLARFSTGNTTTSFIATGVANGRYFVRVLATNGLGPSGPSNEVVVVVGPPAPGAPSGLAWSSAGSSISLSWKAPITGGLPSAYTIEAGAAPGLSNVATFSTASTLTSYSAGGVGNGTYFVRVRATNTAGPSGPSNEVTLVVGCTGAPGVPTGLHTIVNSGGRVQFGWTAPSATDGSNGPMTYILEAGSEPGASDLANSNLGGSGTTFATSGVGAGTYYVRVRAANACGRSGVSNEVALIVR